MLHERYEVADGMIYLIDQELDLNIAVAFTPALLPRCVFYANGQKKEEAYYQDGKLHGPSVVFAENGQILSKSWFYLGLQEGKATFYYASGKLYSVQRFRSGVPHGKQEYFGEDGFLKSILKYQKGLLHGDTHLFWEGDKPKRKSTFVEGKKVQADKIWAQDGHLIVDVEQKNDQC